MIREMQKMEQVGVESCSGWGVWRAALRCQSWWVPTQGRWAEQPGAGSQLSVLYKLRADWLRWLTWDEVREAVYSQILHHLKWALTWAFYMLV